jgi:hypothetical protein
MADEMERIWKESAVPGIISALSSTFAWKGFGKPQ